MSSKKEAPILPSSRKKLGRRLGWSISGGILLISLLFALLRYQLEVRELADRHHEHVGENVAALVACLRQIQSPEVVQKALEDFGSLFHHHLHEFRHSAPRGRHRIWILDPENRILASNNPEKENRPLSRTLQALLIPGGRQSEQKFDTVELEGKRYLYLAEPLDPDPESYRRILYLEPYERVQELALASLWRNLVFSLLLALFLALAVNILVAGLVTRRLELLARAIQKTGQDGMESEIPSLGEDELGAVRDQYARTLQELGRSRSQLEEHAETLEQQVQERSQELMEAHRLATVGELATGVAHNLNNPMASISASADKLLDLLERDPQLLLKRAPRHLERILRNTDRCKTILRSLLDFAREPRFRLQPVSLEDGARGALELLEPRAEEKEIRISYQCVSRLPRLSLDPDVVEQAILNLLDNALEASSSGQEVQLQIVSTSERISVLVQDKGVGIPEEIQEQIFEPFFTTRTSEQGTGLGLSWSRSVVEHLGGRLELLESQPGNTCFSLSFPSPRASVA